jgi:hypothetical protein
VTDQRRDDRGLGALLSAWRDAERQLPNGIELGGVVYHGPDRMPGTEWIAFALNSEGQVIGPEGAGADPVAALAALTQAMSTGDIGGH